MLRAWKVLIRCRDFITLIHPLGDAGNAELWLAVAVATQSIQQLVHYLLVSREHKNGKG